MKNISTKVDEIKKFNFRVKLLKNITLSDLQLERINNLIFSNCKNTDELVKQLYIYKRKIIGILKCNLKFDEKIIEEENKFFIETIFLSKSKNILLKLHSPIIWDLNKIKKNVILSNLKARRKYFDKIIPITKKWRNILIDDLVKKEIDVISWIFKSKNITHKDWIIVRNRKIKLLEKWEENYQFFMKSIFFLHHFIKSYNLI